MTGTWNERRRDLGRSKRRWPVQMNKSEHSENLLRVWWLNVTSPDNSKK